MPQRVRLKGTGLKIDSSKSIRWNYFTQKPLKILMKSYSSVILGVVLTFLGAVLLCWNESEAVYLMRALDESYNLVHKISVPDIVNSMYNNKLIHVTGTIAIDDPLSDDMHDIRVKAIRLKRRVQVYQWIEEKYTLSDQLYGSLSEESSSYVKMWKDKLINSSQFDVPIGHENPESSPVSSQIWTADVATIGAFQLSPSLKNTFSKFVPFSGDEEPERENLKLHSGMYYQTKDIFTPEVGDVRLQFYFAGHDGELVTIIAKQEGRMLYPYITSDGKELLVIRPGHVTPEAMLSFGNSRSHLFTWFNRISGCFLLYIGANFLSALFQYLGQRAPTINKFTVNIFGSASLTVSSCLSMTIIGFAWLFYSPIMAILLLLVAWSPVITGLLIKFSDNSIR